MTAVTVMCDGGARGNPGVAGAGAVVLGADGELLAYDAERLGFATNNCAEYRALILGLRLAAGVGANSVQVKADSKLVVNQMQGRWRVNAVLRELNDEAWRAASGFDEVTYTWIPRDWNAAADGLANDAMDGLPPREPRNLGGPVETRHGVATGAVRTVVPADKRTKASTSLRVEQTAALAAQLGLTGAVEAVARAIREAAPEDLTEIWDRLPGEAYLIQAIRRSPIAWTRGARTTTSSPPEEEGAA
jgi:probable phosphoglycerate mutase